MTTDAPLAEGTHVPALFAAARAVQLHAYAPYSNFSVGAAIRTVSGTVFASANMENAAYPQGICAEGGALSAMISAGEREIAEVLVIGPDEQLTTPCGGCRQKIREFARSDTLIHVAGPEGVRRTFTMDELLPSSFGPEHLGRPAPGFEPGVDAGVDPGPGDADALDADGG